MPEVGYFIRSGSDESGPFSAKQIKQFAAMGKLKRTDFIRLDGNDALHAAGQVPGLFSSAKPGRVVPPALPPTMPPFPTTTSIVGTKPAKRPRLLAVAGGIVGLLIAAGAAIAFLNKRPPGETAMTDSTDGHSDVRSQSSGLPKVPKLPPFTPPQIPAPPPLTQGQRTTIESKSASAKASKAADRAIEQQRDQARRQNDLAKPQHGPTPKINADNTKHPAFARLDVEVVRDTLDQQVFITNLRKLLDRFTAGGGTVDQRALFIREIAGKPLTVRLRIAKPRHIHDPEAIVQLIELIDWHDDLQMCKHDVAILDRVELPLTREQTMALDRGGILILHGTGVLSEVSQPPRVARDRLHYRDLELLHFRDLGSLTGYFIYLQEFKWDIEAAPTDPDDYTATFFRRFEACILKAESENTSLKKKSVFERDIAALNNDLKDKQLRFRFPAQDSVENRINVRFPPVRTSPLNATATTNATDGFEILSQLPQDKRQQVESPRELIITAHVAVREDIVNPNHSTSDEQTALKMVGTVRSGKFNCVGGDYYLYWSDCHCQIVVSPVPYEPYSMARIAIAGDYSKTFFDRIYKFIDDYHDDRLNLNPVVDRFNGELADRTITLRFTVADVERNRDGTYTVGVVFGIAPRVKGRSVGGGGAQSYQAADGSWIRHGEFKPESHEDIVKNTEIELPLTNAEATRINRGDTLVLTGAAVISRDESLRQKDKTLRAGSFDVFAHDTFIYWKNYKYGIVPKK